MNGHKFSGALIAIILLSCLSCKKSSNDALSNPRMTGVDVISSSSNLHFRITYNVGNSVDSIIMTGSGISNGQSGFKKFVYYTASYNVTDDNGLTFLVNVNTSYGMITKINVADTPSMLYTGTQLMELDNQSVINTYPYLLKTATHYTWSGGDMISSTLSSTVRTFDYDNTKSGQLGDGLRIDQFLAYGRAYYKTNHLPTDMVNNGTWAEQYYYQFDSQGRISQLAKVENSGGSVNDTIFYNYEYY